ncbi:10000_t:CDS:2 [Entrophospora sp. SA101]|nr:10000_t:CDS:2 [Entrophospora sp. SA101]
MANISVLVLKAFPMKRPRWEQRFYIIINDMFMIMTIFTIDFAFYRS